MDLAYQRGARTIWIVNVGDIKPDGVPAELLHGAGVESGGDDARGRGYAIPENGRAPTFGAGAGAVGNRR